MRKKLTLKNAVDLFEQQYGGLRDKDGGEFAWIYESILEDVRTVVSLGKRRETEIALAAVDAYAFNTKEITAEKFALNFIKLFSKEVHAASKSFRVLKKVAPTEGN